MPGIVGAVDAAGIGGGEHLLTRMLDGLHPQAWHKVDRCEDASDQWAVGLVNLGSSAKHPQPARMPGRDSMAFLFGRLHFDSAERRALSQDPAAGEIGDAELALRIYEAEGGHLPRSLRGSFAVTIVDPARRRILVANDTVGQRPVYYCLRGSRLLFGGAVNAILQDSTLKRSVNREAMADLFEYRYLLGEKTLFEGISLLSPGARLLYDMGSGLAEVEEDDSLDDWFGAPADTRAPEVILDELAEIFSAATRRVCDSARQNTVSLSGGMDSRAVLAAIRPGEVKVDSFTVGLPGSVEKKLSRRLARAANCQATYSETDPSILQQDNYLRLAMEAISLTDGMRGSSFHPLTAHLAEKFHQFDLDVVLTGHGGEFAKLDRAYGFSLNVEKDMGGSPQEIKNIVFQKMSDHAWDFVDREVLFIGDTVPNDRQSLYDSFDREFSKIDSSLPIDQKLSYFFLREFFRKHAVLSNRIHGNFSEIEYPFIAEDFVRAVLRAPLHLRLNHGIHRHIIKVHNPALLQVPIADTRVRLDATRLERLVVTRPYSIMRRLGFFDADVAEHYIPKRTAPAIFENTLLTPRCLDRGDLNPDYVKKMIDRFKEGEMRLFASLNHLLSLDMWNRLYIDES